MHPFCKEVLSCAWGRGVGGGQVPKRQWIQTHVIALCWQTPLDQAANKHHRVVERRAPMSTVPPPALSRVRRQCVDSLRTGLHHFLQRRCPSRQGNTSTSTVVAALRAALLRSSPTHAHKCGDLSCFLYSVGLPTPPPSPLCVYIPLSVCVCLLCHTGQMGVVSPLSLFQVLFHVHTLGTTVVAHSLMYVCMYVCML